MHPACSHDDNMKRVIPPPRDNFSRVETSPQKGWFRLMVQKRLRASPYDEFPPFETMDLRDFYAKEVGLSVWVPTAIMECYHCGELEQLGYFHMISFDIWIERDDEAEAERQLEELNKQYEV